MRSLPTEKGSLTIEAALVFPFFLLVFFLFLFLIKAVYIQMVLDNLVRDTAREIAFYAYPLSFYNEWEDERLDEQEPAGKREIEQKVLEKLGTGIGNLLNYGQTKPVEVILSQQLEKYYLNPDCLLLCSLQLPRSEYAFSQLRQNTPGSEASDNGSLLPGRDYSKDDVVLQVQYELSLKLPFFNEAAVLLHSAAIERAWLNGGNGIITNPQEKGLFEDSREERVRTVYVTRTGTKYHLEGCRYLRKSRIPLPVTEAQESYQPCKVCRP